MDRVPFAMVALEHNVIHSFLLAPVLPIIFFALHRDSSDVRPCDSSVIEPHTQFLVIR